MKTGDVPVLYKTAKLTQINTTGAFSARTLLLWSDSHRRAPSNVGDG